MKAVGVLDNPTVSTQIAESYSLSIAAARNTLKRGESIFIESDNVVKYVCVGSAANRGGKGVTALHYVLKKMPDEHQERIRDHIVSVEQSLFLRYIDTASIHPSSELCSDQE
mmetsp:Transcript_10386/g.15397  ORF Transcript_10386/g.15397 Transcript_10386/m.15397 type:complete len:112 (-) Transcript_10386:420-755(-)